MLLGFVPIFVAQMSMSLLIKPIMAEDALFAFIPGYPVRCGSRRPAAPSLRCWDSYLTHDAGGGFLFEFELRAGAQKIGSRAVVGVRRLCSKFGWGGARESLGHSEGHYVVVQIV